MSPKDKATIPKDKASVPKDKASEKSPAEIRAEIDDTREEMGETVADLAAKTDVKAQAQAKLDDVKAAAPESPQEGIAQAQAYAKQNPKPVAIAGALLALFLLWRLLKS